MTRRPEPRALLPGALLTAVAVVLLLVGMPISLGAFTTTVTNSANTAATSAYATTCATASTVDAAYFALPLDDRAGSSTAADVTGNGRPGTYQNTSGIAYHRKGPCSGDTGKSVKLDGSSGYVSGVQAAMASPSVFSEEIWFRVPKKKAGGKLIGLGTAATGASAQYDRHIYMSDNGNLVFGVYPGEVKVVSSPDTYNDNQWHQVVATLAPSGTDAGMRLYLDGSLVVTDPDIRTAQTYSSSTSYWRIGYGNLNGWGVTQPTNFFFNGWLANASIYTTALSPNQVLAHYIAGS